MHEQEFERSVQQKMEELSFQPSFPVWEKVEREIRAEKKRRSLFWLLPLGAGFLAIAIWLFPVYTIINPSSKEVAVKSTHKNLKNSTTSTPSANSPSSSMVVKGAKNQADAYQSKQIKTKKLHLAQAAAKNQFNGYVQDKNSYTTVATEEKAEHDEPIPIGSEATHPNPAPVPLLTAFVPHVLHNLQAVNQPSVNAAPYRQRAIQSRRWQWNFDFVYGRTRVLTSGLFASPVMLDFVNDPLQNSGAPASGFGNRPRLQTAPGAYYATSVQLSRSLGRRFAFQTGVRYSLYTQRASVSQKILPGSFSGNFSQAARESEALYRAGNGAFFRSRLHQFSVPLSIGWQPFGKLPLELESGIAVGYLMGGKSLQYDTASRLYYEVKPHMQRIQLQAHAAVSYPVAKSKQWQWLAGPRMHYHFSDLYPNGVSAARLSAWSIGLQVRRR